MHAEHNAEPARAKYLHELADPNRQVTEWRRIHAEKHERGLKFGGSKRPWPKCTICQRES